VSSTQRIVILVVAAVVLIGGFVLAQGSGDDEDSDQAAQTTQPAPASTVGETAPNEPENPAATTPETTEKPAPRVETIRIRDKGPVGEPKTLEFDSGDTVRLRFVSNVAEEIHIHGYDKYVNVRPDSSATTRFKADAEGIFEIEAHSTGELLAKLQVSP
jgi:plastocyanin